MLDRCRARHERFPRLIVDLVIERRSKAHRAQHTEPIFFETLGGIADRANDLRFDVAAAADEIDHFVFLRIEEHSVDREVAAFRVFFRR